MNNIIDIHSHVIPCVDDGSPDLETSVLLIKEEINQGVNKIICTPHYRRGMFESTKEKILENFNLLKEEIKNRNLDIEIYLGQEIYLRRYESLNHVLDNDKAFSINGNKYLLLEFSYTNELDLSEIVYNAKLRGFTPIIAHIERYEYVDVEKANEIVEAGGLIQVNAASLLGKHGGKIKKRVKNYLKNDLVSFIASDIHSSRINYIEKAYKYIEKKYSSEKAKQLFYDNGLKLLEGKYE